MRGQILLARSGVKIFAGAVVVVGKEGAAHVQFVVQLGGLVTVVNRQDKAAV